MQSFVKSSNILHCLYGTVPVLSKSNRKLEINLWFLAKLPKTFKDFQKSAAKPFKLSFNGVARNLSDGTQVARLGQRS